MRKPLLLAFLLSMTFAVATPHRSTGAVAIEVCQDVSGEQGIGCGTTFPQGIPWQSYVIRDFPAGRYALQRTGPNFTGSPLIIARGGRFTWAFLGNTAFVPPPPSPTKPPEQ